MLRAVVVIAVLVALPARAAELMYSVTLGGPPGQSAAQAVAVDAQGNAYVAGTTRAADFPSTSGSFQPRLSGAATACDVGLGSAPCSDAFVAKLDPSGQIVWATFLGGARDEGATAIAVDARGAVYVAGRTESPDFPATRNTAAGRPASFIAKLDPDGRSLAYSFLFDVGGIGGLAINARGNAYVAGAADTAKLKPTPGAFRTQPAGKEAFAGKLSEAGAVWEYLTFVGGAADETATGIAVNAAGEAYLAGSTDSHDFPGVERGVQKVLDRGPDLFVAKLGAGGDRVLWSTYLGGNGLEFSADIALDASGNAYISSGGYLIGLTLFKLSSDGARLVYSNPIDIRSDGAPAIAVSSAGEAIVAGLTTYRNLPVTPDAVAGANYVGTSFGYVLKLDATGSKVAYASYVGGGTYAFPGGVAVDGAGSLYVAGASELSFVEKTDLTRTRPFRLGLVVNAASYRSSLVAPGEVVSLFGAGLGPATPIHAQAAGGRMPTTLGGSEVLVNGVAAPLLYVSATHINAVIPFGVPAIAELVVRSGSEASNTVSIRRENPPSYQHLSAGIFTLDGSGRGQAVALNQDGTLNSPANPAPRGSVVTVWMSGAGPTDPPQQDGRITLENERFVLVNSVQVSLFGASRQPTVTYAGAAPGFVAGIAQVDFRIPEDAEIGRAVRLFVTVPSSTPAHPVTLAIGP